MSTVLSLGTFDTFHFGHLRLLERAASLGELTVGVNSDRFVSLYKKQAPVVAEQHRLRIVGALKCVDRAVLNDGPGHILIHKVMPDVIVIGSDWHENDYLGQINVSQRELDACGIAVMYLPRTPGVSSTELRLAQ